MLAQHGAKYGSRQRLCLDSRGDMQRPAVAGLAWFGRQLVFGDLRFGDRKPVEPELNSGAKYDRSSRSRAKSMSTPAGSKLPRQICIPASSPPSR